MSQEPKSKSRPIGFILLLLLLPVLYVLSIGPAYKFVDPMDPTAYVRWQTFYAPLWWLYNHFPASHNAFDAYLRLWVPLEE